MFSLVLSLLFVVGQKDHDAAEQVDEVQEKVHAMPARNQFSMKTL